MCLLLALAGLAVATVATLSHAAPRRAGTNGIGSESFFATAAAGARVCQEGELLPAGATAILLSVPAQLPQGPALEIVLRRGRQVLERTSAGTHAGNYEVVAPLTPVAHDVGGVTVCYTVGAGGQIAVIGGYTPPGTGVATLDGRSLGGSIGIGYLRPGRESWWSFAPTIARRIGMGRGDWGGSWMAWAAVLLVLAAIALAVRAVARTVLADVPARTVRRLPAVAWTVLAIGVLNALAWSLITPPFQVPDEEVHVAYAQRIGEDGRPPVRHEAVGLAPELDATMLDTRFGQLGAARKVPALWSPLQQRTLDRALHAGLARRGNGDAGVADSEPPLYYALEAIPYKLASGATLLDRLTAMRVLSAAFAGLTALLCFLFVRECLPGRPWAWTVGGVGAAFVPLLGFVSGGVNPDALLYAVAAALFLCLARAFRRGLTTRRAVAIGVVLGVGAITKINFYGLLPGTLIAVALAARVSEGAWNARAARLVATAVGVGLAPYLALSLLDALVWERALILARTPLPRYQDHGDLGGQLSYLWQVYLPRLPGLRVAFGEVEPPYDLWVKGFLGRFGWITVEYPRWAYRLGAAVLAAVALLAVSACVRGRRVLRDRRPQLLSYALVGGGLLLLLGVAALRGWGVPGIKGAIQGRYMLPLLALFAAALALAARGAGERWGRAAGAAIVVLAIAWSVFGQLLTVAFYYG